MFLMILDLFGLGIACTSINDKSRSILSILHRIIPDDNSVRFLLDSFHRKIADNSWGLTLGRFLIFERTACLGIASAMITFVAFYAQFSESSSVVTNSTMGC
uniref:Uncharacterized protein n=1 Tax=Plectus sambesii TaxID=2011161 RepID=A0A914XI23_9BILA